MNPKKIKKILIANRGEIAVRIHRSASEMGIHTVAIFSDADRRAPHVLNANEAYPLNGNLSKDTYLDIQKIIDIAVSSRCDAIHPGYGFLSENADFVDATTSAGLLFIGPTSAAMRSMGGKTGARDLMAKANVPIVPGTTHALKDFVEAFKVAQSIGYPVLIKAVHGGGGKGMRRVDRAEDLEHALTLAKSESKSAFGSESVFIEKYLQNPRHIEIQILADMHGNTIYLGERECSVQRRHQKVVEECPSSVLTPDIRKKMGEAAVNAARKCGYVNAGTVEFLLDSDKSFYFLEMNTRLQVEHPVTELVFGLDLVKAQIQIAEGEKLSMTQAQAIPRGHAIECRIYAEDPFEGFIPSTGKIEEYIPSEGNGIRHDSGIMPGSEIVHFYDPLLSKLAVWGADRSEAIRKMKRALREFKISGVSTTIPFCSFVIDHPKFIDGDYDIHFVEKYYYPAKLMRSDEEELVASLAAASMHNWNTGKGKENREHTFSSGNWKKKRFDE